MPASPAVDGPAGEAITAWTDVYFKRTKGVVARFGDCAVTYAVFMRRPVLSAPRLAVAWLESVARKGGSVPASRCCI